VPEDVKRDAVVLDVALDGGLDLLHVAALVVRGKLVVVEQARLHAEADGARVDIARVHLVVGDGCDV
jgi:hypothetical protein